MNTDPPTPEHDDALENRLRQHLQSEYLDDGGFTRRALAAIPSRARPVRRQVLITAATVIGLAIAATASGGATQEVQATWASLRGIDFAIAPETLATTLWTLNLAVALAMPAWILHRHRRTG